VKEKTAPTTTKAAHALRRVVHTLLALEERYQKLQKGGTFMVLHEDEEKQLFNEGRKFVKEGRFGEAEKRFLDVYEDLGALYILTKQYDQAEETLKFVQKAKPNDASVLVHLGELALAQGDAMGAHAYFSSAIDFSPNNPKYLDFYIEAGLRAGKSSAVRDGLERLKSVNPENQKLPLFAERLIELEGKEVNLPSP
jgi:tetratricopeptide (TPR) repeat protein